MANQYGRQFSLTKEPQVWKFYGVVTFGSSGAPTLGTAKGITSITRNSAGKYTIKLSDAYVGFLMVATKQLVASGAPAAPFCHMVSEAVATAGTQSVVIQYLAVDNTTATDPASGEKLYFEVTVKNSSAY
jgi:hypothetical protein